MQDRFRFRFWDEKALKWFYFGFETFPTYEKQIWEALTDGKKIYQCTGIKDKKGKFIYEGDILRNVKTGELLTVAWHSTMAGYVWSKSISNSYLNDCGAVFRAFDKYEIVGNIYKRPELLEGGKYA